MRQFVRIVSTPRVVNDAHRTYTTPKAFTFDASVRLKIDVCRSSKPNSTLQCNFEQFRHTRLRDTLVAIARAVVELYAAIVLDDV